MDAKQRRSKLVAEHLAAAELMRAGHLVTMMGDHHPVYDLEVLSPKTNTTFYVDVKGKSRSSRWLVDSKKPTKNLFYILVRIGAVLPDRRRNPDRFFIVPQSDQLKITAPGSCAKAPTGFRTTDVLEWEGKWSLLPD